MVMDVISEVEQIADEMIWREDTGYTAKIRYPQNGSHFNTKPCMCGGLLIDREWDKNEMYFCIGCGFICIPEYQMDIPYAHSLFLEYRESTDPLLLFSCHNCGHNSIKIDTCLDSNILHGECFICGYRRETTRWRLMQ